MTTARPVTVTLRLLFDVGVPLALYYGLRAAGANVYLALLVSTVVPAFSALIPLVRGRRVNGIALYMTVTMLAGVLVSLLAGSPRFLLAKEGWVTALAGVWFLASLFARRPLAYLYTQPLLEGRLGWPGDWEGIWERSRRFRWMWRVSSILWGIGTLTDSALRVVMAYTLPIDEVPALGTALYGVTSGVLLVVTNVYYLITLRRSPEWWPERRLEGGPGNRPPLAARLGIHARRE